MTKEINQYRVLGLMSGTSMDGLDMAVCNFYLENGEWSYMFEKGETTEYPKTLLECLKKAYTSNAREITELDSLLGKFIGRISKSFLDNENTKVDLISSHGHTIFHEPDKGYTLQIGSGAEIAAESGIKTICDFRSIDVARGGQGAPLVPIGDKLLFSEYDVCLNLGGFANVSFDNEAGSRIAFDICPVNFVMNRLANQLDADFDNKGELARSGRMIPELFDALNKLEFYNQTPPKSLGQEWVEKNVLNLLSRSDKVEDKLRTFIEHVSLQISNVLNECIGKKVLITGGGVFNDYLVQLISEKCTKEIVIPSKELIDFKEALVFAFLGVLRLRGEVNSLSSVTGASVDSINGSVYLP